MRGAKKHIFILGLKRSGTTIFWKTLRQDPRFICYDEPFRPEIRAHLETGKNHKKKVFNEYLARPELINEYWSYMQPYEQILPRLLGHRAQYVRALLESAPNVCIDFVRCHAKLTHLREIAPDALIIHLVRDPRAFVTSHLKPYGKWIAPQLPQQFFSYNGWFDFWRYQTLSEDLGVQGYAHEKLLQLWKFFTQTAEAQKPDMTIQFEEFAVYPDSFVKKVYEWLDIDYTGPDYSQIHAPHKPFKVDGPAWDTALEKFHISTYFRYEFTDEPSDILEMI